MCENVSNNFNLNSYLLHRKM